MKLADVEDRVRQMPWPEPPAELRARVLSGDPVDERWTSWVARGTSDPSAREISIKPAATTDGRHGWRRFGIATALGLLLMAGSCAALDVIEGHRVEAEIARFEAKYGSLVEAPTAGLEGPPSDNRAIVVRAATELVVRVPGQTYHFIDPRVGSPVPANLRAFAEANRDAIRVAGGVRNRHESNWNIDYRSDMLPYEPIRILSDAIYLTALMHLEAGRSDDAIGDVVTGLGVAASLRQERSVVIQHLWMSNVSWPQFNAARDILARSEPSPRALAELAALLAEDRAPEPMLASILDEVRATNAIFARMENGDIDPGIVSYIYPMTWPSWPSTFVPAAARIGRPFVRQARVRYLQHMEQVLDVLTSPRPHRAMPEYPTPRRWELVDRLTEKFAGFTGMEARSADDYLSGLAAAQLAVALRRYRQDYGTYPDDLSRLVPKYLASVPNDPFTGRPPVYARQGGGFTLRSTHKSWLPIEWTLDR